MDVFADFPAYLRARDRLRAIGYRLCLDELTAAGNSRLKELADHGGRGRIVLTDIDSDLGVRHAHAVGVTLFQGPWVEAALTKAPSAA